MTCLADVSESVDFFVSLFAFGNDSFQLDGEFWLSLICFSFSQGVMCRRSLVIPSFMSNHLSTMIRGAP